MTQDLSSRLSDVRSRIRAAERASDRAPGSVRLLAVSKQQSAETVAAAFALGQTRFGENYLQEAIPKIEALRHLAISWHFIGQIQANKTRILAERFDWAHTVDRLRIAQRLSDQRPEGAPPLDVCVQVNLDREPGKAGVVAGEAAALARAVRGLPRLRLRGLMAIPRPRPDREQQVASLLRLKALFDQLNREGLSLDTLSIGMTDDFEAAIAAGSTVVRIGTAIFGPRVT